jgi:hypothetical protein
MTDLEKSIIRRMVAHLDDPPPRGTPVNEPLQDGARVRVAIKDRNEYAHGAAESLDGHTGTIERAGRPGYLVKFDAPLPRTWWTHQSPVTAFWFARKDLKPEETTK